MAIYVNGSRVLGNVKRNGVVPDKVKANGVTVWEKPIGSYRESKQITIGTNNPSIDGYWLFAGHGDIDNPQYRGHYIDNVLSYRDAGASADFGIQIRNNHVGGTYPATTLLTSIRLVGEDWGLVIPVVDSSNVGELASSYYRFFYLSSNARGIWQSKVGQTVTVEFFGY